MICPSLFSYQIDALTTIDMLYHGTLGSFGCFIEYVW